MNIFVIDRPLVARGRAAFRSCISQYLGNGENDREGGVEMIPGAIVAAIEAGITTRDEIVMTVSRVTRCRSWNVEEVLDTLGEPTLEGRLWASERGRYHRVVEEYERPITVMMN